MLRRNELEVAEDDVIRKGIGVRGEDLDVLRPQGVARAEGVDAVRLMPVRRRSVTAS